MNRGEKLKYFQYFEIRKKFYSFWGNNKKSFKKFKNNELIPLLEKEMFIFDSNTKLLGSDERMERIIEHCFPNWIDKFSKDNYSPNFNNLKDICDKKPSKLSTLIDFANQILTLIYIENKLLIVKKILGIIELELDNEKECQEIIGILEGIISYKEYNLLRTINGNDFTNDEEKYFPIILNFKKDEKTYREKIIDVINQLKHEQNKNFSSSSNLSNYCFGSTENNKSSNSEESYRSDRSTYVNSEVNDSDTEENLENENWQKIKFAKIKDFLVNEENAEERERKQAEWEEYLFQLEDKTENSWMKEPENQEDFFVALKAVIEKGYQASDKIIFTKSDKSIIAQYDAGEYLVDATFWEKKRAIYFYNECAELVDEIQSNLNQYPNWEENVNSEIGERKEGDTKEVTARIEEYIISLKLSEEEICQKIDSITKLAKNEISTIGNSHSHDEQTPILTKKNDEEKQTVLRDENSEPCIDDHDQQSEGLVIPNQRSQKVDEIPDKNFWKFQKIILIQF